MIKRQWLRPDQAAQILNCSTKTVYRLCSAGEIDCFRLAADKNLRVCSDSLDSYIKRKIIEFQEQEGIFWD